MKNTEFRIFGGLTASGTPILGFFCFFLIGVGSSDFFRFWDGFYIYMGTPRGRLCKPNGYLDSLLGRKYLMQHLFAKTFYNVEVSTYTSCFSGFEGTYGGIVHKP